MAKTNHGLKLLIVMVSVFIIGYILEPFRNISPLLGDYFEVSTELLPLVMSFSIFVTTWFAYNKSRDDNSFFLGASFFVMGLLELFQMLSHPYMPDFITPNSIQKAVTFRVMLWTISVLLFFVSAHIYKDSIPGIISKYVIFAFAIILSLMVLTIVLFYPNRLPEVYSLKGSLSTTWFSLVLITSIMLFYSSFLYLKRLRKTGEMNIICLIYGFVLTSVSILVYFDYTYSGYLLQAAGFYFVYLAMIKSSIERPYENLAIAEHKMRYVAEEKYRNLFDNANDAIVITDLDDRIISWNRSAENIFGWSAEEVAEKKFSELVVPPRLHTEMNHIMNNVISGNMAMGFDFVNLHKDGNEIDVSMTISHLLNSEHNIIGLSSIVRDITERKRVEKALQESEDRYRMLVELSPNAIAVYREGKIVFMNTSGARLLGAENPKQLLGKNIIDFVHPDYRELFHDRVQVILNEGQEAPLIEEKFIRLDKKVIDVEEVAMPFIYRGNPAVQAVITDITERKLAAEALRSSEEQFRSLIENSSDIIMILSDNGKIFYLSPSIERSFGYRPEELIGKNISELIHPDDLPGFFEVFIRKIQNPNTTSSIEFRARHKDGAWRILESIGKTLPHGLVVTGMVLNSRDITERKRDEEQIRSSLHEKEVLLREIHHRVKNNMQVLSSLLRLQSDFCKDKNVIEMFNESRNRIISMSLIHEKLYLSKDFTKIDLKGYINEMVNGLFQSYCLNKSKIALNIYVEDVPLGIESAIPCGLIINELVTNSLKYAFPGDRNGEIKIILRLAEENMIELVISDNGIGVPKSLNMQKIESLGLHLVTMLAENQLMGKMNMNIDNGTEFQIRFRGVK